MASKDKGVIKKQTIGNAKIFAEHEFIKSIFVKG